MIEEKICTNCGLPIIQASTVTGATVLLDRAQTSQGRWALDPKRSRAEFRGREPGINRHQNHATNCEGGT